MEQKVYEYWFTPTGKKPVKWGEVKATSLAYRVKEKAMKLIREKMGVVEVRLDSNTQYSFEGGLLEIRG